MHTSIYVYTYMCISMYIYIYTYIYISFELFVYGFVCFIKKVTVLAFITSQTSRSVISTWFNGQDEGADIQVLQVEHRHCVAERLPRVRRAIS